VPLLAEYHNRRGETETKLLVDRVATALFLVVLVVTALGIAATPLLIYLTAPGFAADADKFALTVELTRITFPTSCSWHWSRSPPASSIPGAASPCRRSHRYWLNLSFIGMALLAAPYFDPPSWCWPGRYSSAAGCNWPSNCRP